MSEFRSGILEGIIFGLLAGYFLHWAVGIFVFLVFASYGASRETTRRTWEDLERLSRRDTGRALNADNS